MTFTESYYLEELSRFRQHMGDKSWWNLTDEQRDAYIRGLGLVYLNINNEDGTPITKDQIEKWAGWFAQITAEYHRRWTYIKLKF